VRPCRFSALFKNPPLDLTAKIEYNVGGALRRKTIWNEEVRYGCGRRFLILMVAQSMYQYCLWSKRWKTLAVAGDISEQSCLTENHHIPDQFPPQRSIR